MIYKKEPFLILALSAMFLYALPQSVDKSFTPGYANYSRGLFDVYKLDDKWMFEIPHTLLQKDIFILTRILRSGISNDEHSSYKGDLAGKRLIRLSVNPDKKLLVEAVDYFNRATDSTSNGMSASLAGSRLYPIAASFEMRGTMVSKMNIAIDVTEFLNEDNDLLFFDENQRGIIQPGSYQRDKSSIVSVQSFPGSIEVKCIKTYKQGQRYVSYLLNTSIMLLDNPMAVRYYNDRVGYFASKWIEFDSEHNQAKEYKVINRWRLEPKSKDLERYKRGELVEPLKPIVFVIDPTTPKKWVPYIIQGVNAWQKPFERAGFKNAIYALELDSNDNFLTKDGVFQNAIIWNPSVKDNAMGQIVVDPRSGEIINANVHWYYNELKWNEYNYFVLASPTDPRARTASFDDTLMGQIIKSVITHEIGHTLGLAHNFTSSSTIPVELLRDKKWLDQHGFCPSIMDYARYNYVAQPEDSIDIKGLTRRIGEYDEWAIEWGYRFFSGFQSNEQERVYMNNWISDRLKKNGRLLFGGEGPENQTEDLGDNAVKASTYGINNLKIVIANLLNWTSDLDRNRSEIESIYNKIIDQYKCYLNHVSVNIGGKYKLSRSDNKGGRSIEFVNKVTQKNAVKFLHQQLFATPAWLFNRETISETGGEGMFLLLELQEEQLKRILSPGTFIELVEFESKNSSEAYTSKDLLRDIGDGIWQELENHSPIDIYRRNLQKAFVIQLAAIIGEGENITQNSSRLSKTDVIDQIKAYCEVLLNKINQSKEFYHDGDNILHLKRIAQILQKSIS